jgi:hypothetical protein
MGHLDYILLVLIAAELLIRSGTPATVRILGNYHNAPFAELLDQLRRLRYVIVVDISAMTAAEYVEYALRGDEKSFFIAAKALENFGYGTYMGFGANIPKNLLSSLDCIRVLKMHCAKKMQVEYPGIVGHVAVHVRTDAYKGDSHMNFRNSRLVDVIKALSAVNSREPIGILGHYSENELSEASTVLVDKSLIPPIVGNGSHDFYLAGSSKYFVATTSGPGHIGAYLVPTLIINATCLIGSLVCSEYTVLCPVRLQYQQRKPSTLGVTLDDVIMLILSDYWGDPRFGSIFSLRALTSTEIQHELLEFHKGWSSDPHPRLGMVNHAIFGEITHCNTRITSSTLAMLNSLIHGYA